MLKSEADVRQHLETVSANTPSAITPDPYPAPAIAWYTVGVLLVMYSVALLDRFIISLLVDPIKSDLGINDFQIGVLQGAFSILYAVGAVPIGWLVDRWLRRWVIFLGVVSWSLATAACGLATNFWQLFVARIGVGAGEAALHPAALSILGDSFPRERLTLAIATCLLGTSFGQGFAFAFGGILIAQLSAAGPQSFWLVGELKTWQIVFVAVGLPGVFLSFLIFTIKEPLRRNDGLTDDRIEHHGGLGEYFAFLKPRRRFMICHHIGFSLALIVQAAISTWLPVHMIRGLGLDAGQTGMLYGLLYGLCTPGGLVLGGWIIDSLFKRGIRDAHLRVFVVCLVAAIPLAIYALMSSSLTIFIVASATSQILLGALPATAVSALQVVTPSRLRGRVSAVFLMFFTLTGASLGPALVGFVTDYVFIDAGTVGLSIATIIAVCAPLSALVLASAMKPMRKAVDAVS